jgi:hypothetical protein
VSEKRREAGGVDHAACNALALSILQHRHFCDDCEPHAEQAILALLGATVDELRQRLTA